MRLDWDLCREILLVVEREDHGTNDDIKVEIEDRDDREISYHLRALTQAGYIKCEVLPDTEDDFLWFVPQSLHWSGHKFLAGTRDNSIWKTVLNRASEKATSVTLDTLLALAVAEAKRRVGLGE